jgi:hypothetical protein
MKKNRIDSMFEKGENKENFDQEFEEFQQFLAWKQIKTK